MIAVWINEFEAASAAGRPVKPAALFLVSDLILNHVDCIGHEAAEGIGFHVEEGLAESDSFTTVTERAAVIAERIVRVQIVVMREQVRLVFRDNKVSIRSNDDI